jgi:hypothetical protein
MRSQKSSNSILESKSTQHN